MQQRDEKLTKPAAPWAKAEWPTEILEFMSSLQSFRDWRARLYFAEELAVVIVAFIMMLVINQAGMGPCGRVTDSSYAKMGLDTEVASESCARSDTGQSVLQRGPRSLNASLPLTNIAVKNIIVTEQ